MITAGTPLDTPDRKQILIQCGGALILGSALPLAFAPFHLWPLAILLPAGLIWVLERDLTLRQLFLAGYCFGLGYLGFGVYWIYNSLHDFGQAPPIVAGGLTGLLIVYLALYPAASLVFWGYASRAFGRTSLWFLPLFWFSFEWLKGWVITGMPWLSLGYSQTNSPLAGYAPLIGVYGISAMCILMSVALVLLIRERRFSMFGVLIGVPLAGWLALQTEWTEPVESLKVTMVQGNIPQEIKWRGDQQQSIFNTYWRETSMNWNSDLIVWPETALPGNSIRSDVNLLRPMQQAAIEKQTPIMTGVIGAEKDGSAFYNSVVLLNEDRTFYHKRHLVMFGEYYPMRWLLKFFSSLILIPYSDLTPGPDLQSQMRVRDLSFGISICFEDVFSRDVFLDLPQAHILVNVSNDAWFGDSTAPHQHLQIAQMRSLEAERPMLRSTNTGVSGFIDHKGRIFGRSDQFKTQSITATVTGRTGSTPFNYFLKVQGIFSLAIIILTLIFVRRGNSISLS